jgi:predicted AlkP superfamily phosphohydrolase/phosphomutase
MSRRRGRVLAIAIDAAEPELIRESVGRGLMPSLKRLADEGAWAAVTSPSHVGSGAVWPTFITGGGPSEHGIYGEWCWRPETMSLSRYAGDTLTPFWAELARGGVTVGLLDVPFAPIVGLTKGFEVSEWGPHDVLWGRTQAAPSNAEALLGQFDPHPFSSGRLDAAGPGDDAALARLSAACVAGVRLRGDLAVRLLSGTSPQFSLVVFPELHTASHHLWHTVAPDHPFYSNGSPEQAPPAAPAITDILRETDRQIGRLVGAAGEGASVLVFSLHGMRPTRGIPALLGDLLHAWGFARLSGWGTQSWAERARTAFAAAKRRTPRALKKLYYGAVSQTVAQRLAQTTMLPAYHWPLTRAFPLPTDQHGWVRLNVAGREAAGVVAAAEIEATCARLAELLSALRTDDGRRVVREVFRPAGEAGGAGARQLPDLIIHWDDAAFDDPVVISDPPVRSRPAGLKFTGQHAPEGFCVARGLAGVGAKVAAADMHRLMIAALGG